MAEPTPIQQQRIDRICTELNNYMNARAEHAIRVNPQIRDVLPDMVFQHMQRVRSALAIERIFSQNRFMVCDIFASGDEKKKVDLILANSQNCIMPLLVQDLTEDAKQQKGEPGRLQVHDTRSLYAALNPQLSAVMELIEIWAWWDLPSAGYIAFFNDQQQQLEALIGNGFKARKDLNAWLRDPAPDLKLEELMTLGEAPFPPGEAAGRLYMALLRARNHFQAIVEHTASYMMILKRQPGLDLAGALSSLLIEAGRRLMTIERVQGHKILDAQLAQHYARVLQCPEEDLHPELILEHEQEKIEQLLVRLSQELAGHSQQGKPYDYKQSQLQSMNRVLEDLRQPLGIDSTYQAADEDAHGAARMLLSTQEELAAMQDQSENITPLESEPVRLPKLEEDEPGPLGF